MSMQGFGAHVCAELEASFACTDGSAVQNHVHLQATVESSKEPLGNLENTRAWCKLFRTTGCKSTAVFAFLSQ